MMIADFDDKYAKMQAKKGACETIGSLSLRSLTKKDLSVLLRSPFQVYACFLMALSMGYYLLGGRFSRVSLQEKIATASIIAETVGLIVLGRKIRDQGSVAGISGMSIGMYSLVYALRQVMLLPQELSWFAIDGWAMEVLQLPSILIVLDVLRSVFGTHRKTYQEDLDWLNIKYLIPVCILLAVLICPQFEEGPMFSFFQACYMYLDMIALMPQVVMMSNMARAGGKVEAPIAHFVAATAIRELADLGFWLSDFELGPQGYYRGFNYSGWICVLTQALAVLLVADFMYYYFKARFSGAALSEDLALPTDPDV